MTEFGACENANFQESTYTINTLQKKRARITRTLVLPDRYERVAAIARQRKNAGIKTLVVFTTQSAGCDFENYDLYNVRLSDFLSLAHDWLHGVETYNELDAPDFGISDDQIVEAGRRAADTVHQYSEVLAYSPSFLTGPEEGRFEYCAQRLEGWSDRMTVHPYYCSVANYPYPGWYFGTVEGKANIVRAVTNIPTCFSELGCPTQWNGIGEERQARFWLALRDFQHPAISEIIGFCKDDYMVPSEELAEGKDWGIEGKFAEDWLMTEEQYQFVLGFKMWHDLEPELIGEPLQNEKGPWEGMSQQLTTRGLLSWTPVGFTFWEFDTHDMYAWQPTWGKSART